MNELDVKEKLLQSACKEFIHYGFKKASIRNIAAGAGVTIGALYYFFKNKEALFLALTESPAKQFDLLFEKWVEDELKEPSSAASGEHAMMEFFINNKDAFILLTEKAEGTVYEGYTESCMAKFIDISRNFFCKYIKAPDDDLIRLVAYVRFKGIAQIVMSDIEDEKKFKLSEQFGLYSEAGFAKLIQMNVGEII
ncbi:MAG: TetR/AcrR family transcriptional regulator [Saccharofermentans sp.]|nr:TetR/AcrR family transcriptional regulator [Saccharofermentans sp.]